MTNITANMINLSSPEFSNDTFLNTGDFIISNDPRIARIHVALGILSQYTDSSEASESPIAPDDSRIRRLTTAIQVINHQIEQIKLSDGQNINDTADSSETLHTSLNDAQEALVIKHMGLVESIANKYAKNGEPFEDLVQVGYIGLMKAAKRFDPSVGSFINYAAMTVRGEIKRYFRDYTWSIRVSRDLKDIGGQIFKTESRLEAFLGRKPTIKEAADELGISVDVFAEAKNAWHNYKVNSLDKRLVSGESDTTLGDMITDAHDSFKDLDNKQFIEQLFKHLDPREITILKARAGMDPFDHELTQSEIADLLCISQVHVGRLETSALEKLYELGIDSFNS